MQSFLDRLLDAVFHFLPAFSLVKHCCLDIIFTRVLRPYLLNTQHSVAVEHRWNVFPVSTIGAH